MTCHRVVITGVGVASPIGNNLDDLSRSLQTGRHGIVTMPEWDRIADLRTRLGGVVSGLDLTGRWPRKRIRTMGRVALMATYASEQALAMAGLTDPELLGSGSVGIAYGSTSGSSEALAEFCTTLLTNMSMRGLQSTSFLKFMAHTCAANLAQFFGVRGRIIPTNSACTSGAQAIGYAYEAIRFGRQDIMIAGGSDEMHYTTAVTFDLMFATSAKYNSQPELSPRPFDRQRDGLVVGEGAATVVLERRDRAISRGAQILGEISGFGTNCDGIHMTAPSELGMRGAMAMALQDAGITARDLDYVNAHGTATDIGDIAESNATREVLGPDVPLSSCKSFMGHTMGACGAIELACCLAMLRDNFIAPNRNLDEIDPRCAVLNYVRELQAKRLTTLMTNNFAFGGVNTSLIVRRGD